MSLTDYFSLNVCRSTQKLQAPADTNIEPIYQCIPIAYKFRTICLLMFLDSVQPTCPQTDQ